MARERITIEAHHDGRWHQAAELVLFDIDQGRASRTQLAYVDAYIEEQIESLGAHDQRAVAESHPVGFGVWTRDGWPPFLLDIVPSGAARRWWTNRLGARFQTEAQLDSILLREHTVAPVGHLRIATPPRPGEPMAFSKEDVMRRDTDFLEYAAARGAAIGGATGAGGDAPKILLAADESENVYPAGTLPDEETRATWLVKWPRGADTRVDRLVLRTEHQYARALADVGLHTCQSELRSTLPESKPSLWLSRFDRIPTETGLERVAVESLYSLAGVHTTGASMKHQEFLSALREALERRDQLEDLPALVREYVRRDLLDVILGNSDNHGRNRAVIRGERLTWAPIYDLAPMVMDPAGITRSTTWERHEYGGRIDWTGVCRELDEWLPGLDLEETLRSFSERLLDLPEYLRGYGIAEEVLAHPRIHIGRLPETLERWGLL